MRVYRVFNQNNVITKVADAELESATRTTACSGHMGLRAIPFSRLRRMHTALKRRHR